MNIGSHFARAAPAATIVLLSWTVAGAQTQAVQSFPLNVYKSVLDGQWQGIRYASDGNVYFGSSTHSAHHGAAFFKFDPRTRQITMLAEDLTTICGEDPQTNPQGKLHSDIVEANGWLYMSMHFSSELPGAYEHWTGSHVIGYQLATGAFHDFGVVHPNYTSYSAIGVDPARHYLYIFVTGQDAGDVSYLYRIDTITGAKTNLGQVGGAWDASFWTFVDRRGDVWFSVSSGNGALHRVNGATGRIDVFPNALPPMYRWDSQQLVSPAEQAKRWIMWMQPLDGDRALFTLGWNGGMLYLFDSTKPIGSGQEFQPIKHIGYSDLGLAIGGSRLFYYQRANRGFGQQEATDFHLLSVSLDAATGYAMTDHGLLEDQNGRVAWRLPGMATDGENRLFMMGDWWTLPGEEGTLRYNYANGVESYLPLPRGEFFAVTDVPDAEPPPAENPPPPPVSLVATTSSTTEILLRWTDTSAIETGFRIERCAGTGCTSFIPAGEVGSNVMTFLSGALDSSTLYRFRVAAINASGSSNPSNIAEAISLPTIPTALAAVAASSSQINVTWLAAPGATGTRLERCTGAGCTNFVQVAQLTTNTFASSGLTASTLYRFRVRAYNAGGSSAYSAVVDTPTTPQTPGGLSVTPISTGELLLRWTDTAGETGYRVERCTGAACTGFAEIAQTQTGVVTFSNAGLPSGTLHRYRVKAFNLGGNSAASNIAEATTLPPIPQGVTSSVISSVQVNLAWTAVGGGTGVRIERCQGAGCSTFVQVVQLTGATTYASTGLAPGTVYRYRLRAYNAGGQSAYSDVVDATTPPAVPSTLTVTSGTSSTLMLRWIDTSGETGFRIERCLGTSCATFSVVAETSANTVTVTDTNLQNGAVYRYRVRAFNAGGSSNPSNIAQGITLPAPPSGLSATAVSSSQINLVWAGAVGSSGTRIERCAGAQCTAFTLIAQVASGVTTLSNTSLTPGATYRYRARTFNAAGQSVPSNIAEATTVAR